MLNSTFLLGRDTNLALIVGYMCLSEEMSGVREIESFAKFIEVQCSDALKAEPNLKV